MGKKYSVYLGIVFTCSAALALAVERGDAEPSMENFCAAELAARSVLVSTYWPAVERAKNFLQKQREGEPVPQQLDWGHLAVGTHERQFKGSSKAFIIGRLAALVQEFSKGPDESDRTAFKIIGSQQIESYLAAMVERLRDLDAKGEPDLQAAIRRTAPRFQWSLSRWFAPVGVGVLTFVGILAATTLGDSPLLVVPDWVTDNAPAAGVLGAFAIVWGLGQDIIQWGYSAGRGYFSAPPVPIEKQGAARMENILNHIRAGNFLPSTATYYGGETREGQRIDLIYEVIRGEPTLSVFRWKGQPALGLLPVQGEVGASP